MPALWKYRCGFRYGRAGPTKETWNALWVAELGHWGRGEPVSISPRSAQQVRQAIWLWIVHRRKPVQVADPGLPATRIRKDGQQEHKEQHQGAGRAKNWTGSRPQDSKGCERMYQNSQDRDGAQYVLVSAGFTLPQGDVCFFVRDSAPYMTKAAECSKTVNIYLAGFTCLLLFASVFNARCLTELYVARCFFHEGVGKGVKVHHLQCHRRLPDFFWGDGDACTDLTVVFFALSSTPPSLPQTII